MLYLKLLLFLSLCLLFDHADSTACVQIENNYWQEIWSSHFDDAAELKNNWVITKEEDVCYGNGASQISCNSPENVHVNEGYLYLQTKREKHYSYNYTGANIDSIPSFSYGRYEARARMSRGYFIQANIEALGDSNNFTGQMNIVSYVRDNTHYRGIFFPNEDNDFINLKYRFKSATEAANKMAGAFHIYGVEWSPMGFRFSYDDVYSEWLNFTESHNLTSKFFIRMQVGVGGRAVKYKIPITLQAMNWSCPALVVDYVKIYEVLDRNATDCQLVSYSGNQTDLDAEAKHVDTFCSKLEIEKFNFQSSASGSKGFRMKPQYIVVGLLIAFMIAVLWMVVLLRRVHGRLRESDKNNEDDVLNFDALAGIPGSKANKDDEEVYEEIEDYDYETISSHERRVPYLQLDDVYKTQLYLQMENQYDHLCEDVVKHPNNNIPETKTQTASPTITT